jgi:HK97 family phage major capsid protein
VAVFGDLGGYIVADRQQLSVTVLKERYADTDQVGLVLIDRVGGGLANPDSIRIGVV